jgi:uncharacterized protein (DUF4415 family)
MKKRTTSKTSQVSKTDWKRIDSTRDKDIDYSDIPRLSPEEFARGAVRWGTGERVSKEQVTLRLDADVLSWFRARGKGYQTQINLLLRAYMDAHEGKPPVRRP